MLNVFIITNSKLNFLATKMSSNFLLIHFLPIEFAEDIYGETGKFLCTEKWIIKFNFTDLMIYFFVYGLRTLLCTSLC